MECSKHVLIVDDEPNVAFFLRRALERSNQGYCVSVAHSGEEALEILERSPVDLLVTDLRMPGISGLDLIRRVRAINPATRTILITAYGDEEVEAEARRLEAYKYITKPFDMADFTQAVEHALQEVALARPGMVVLSDKCFEAIAERLEDLRREVGAQCIFLADMQGQQLVEIGETEGLDVVALLVLLAGGIAASAELARQLGDQHPLNLNFHEGSRFDIYSATVGEGLFLAIVCDRQVQPSRIGLVWFYTRRAIEDLRATLSSVGTASTSPTLGEEFGTSLAEELDALFAGGEGDGLSPQGVSAAGEEEVPSIGQEGGEEGDLPRPSMPEEETTETELLDWETAVKRGLVPPDIFKTG